MKNHFEKIKVLFLGKSFLRCAIFFAILLGSFLFVRGAIAETYYVDVSGGDDNNLGTATDQAWKTIAKVNSSSFFAGDSVLFKKGEIWWETLTVPSSGANENPIIFGAYGSRDKPIINSVNSYQYNNSSIAEFDQSGLGHSWNAGYSLNGDLEHHTLNDFDYINETVAGTTATVTADTSTAQHGSTSAKLFDGDGYARLGHGFLLVPNQKYEISFWAKSDGIGTAATRFYQASNGLANIKTGEIYQTWTGYQNIGDLHVNATDTDWTEKKIILQVDNSSHSATFQITSEVANQSVWIDAIRVRPLWTNYSGDIWMSGHDAIQTGSIYMTSFDGIPTKKASDKDNVNSTLRWFDEALSGSHNHIVYVNSPSGDPSLSDEYIYFTTTTNSKSVDLNSQNYITLQDLDIQNGYYNVGGTGNNITIDNCSMQTGVYNVRVSGNNFTLKNSTIKYADWMILIGASDGALIQNNSVSGAQKFAPGVTGGEGGAIAASGKITNLVVENNTIHDCESYGIAEYGVDASNRIENAIYRQNNIYDCLYGFWSMSLSNGIYNSKFYYNKIYQPKSGDSVGLRIYRPGNSVYLYNNSVSGFKYGIEMWNGVNSLIAENNIIANSSTFNIYDRSDNSSGTLNHNLYYPAGSGTFDYHGDSSLDFSGWKTASSQDTNSISLDPLFVSPSDFHLRNVSPTINAGADVGLTADYEGNPIVGLPDIGAYEYQPSDTNENEDDDNERDINVNKVKAVSTQNSITITWKTDHNAKSTIRYGTDKSLKEKKKDNDKEKKHRVILTNLLLDTQYYFRIKSQDGDDNEDKSKIHSIRTKSALKISRNANSNQNIEEKIVAPSYSGNPAPNACSYTVQVGDTLWKIARKVYNDPNAYPLIIEKNKDKYPNIASVLSIGQELTFDCENNGEVQGASDEEDNVNGSNDNSEIQTQESTPTSEFRWWNPFSWF